MGQSDLHPVHYTELVTNSGIDRALVMLNFGYLEGNSIYDRLFTSSQIPRTNGGQITPRWLRRYAHCTKGGWWCSGLDPLNDWKPMEWGTFKPRFPAKNQDGKSIKYEHPPGTTTRLFCLRVTLDIWKETAKIFNKKLPAKIKIDRDGEAVGFWQWVLNCQIPILICEGVKKAATLMTYGYPAIALPGINSGYRVIRDFQGNTIDRNLIPELAVFNKPKQDLHICFDYESVAHKSKLIDTAITHLGELLDRGKSNVKVVRLPGVEKGVDDFILAQGIGSFRQLYSQALELEIDIAYSRRDSELTYPPNLAIESR